MDHYLDIRLRSDPDFPAPMLMGALYGKLHRALYDFRSNDIGVSWPDHKTGVSARSHGDRLRLHSRRERLEQLMGTAWLTGMRDHVIVEAVQPIPDNPRHRTVSRRQFNTGSPSRARRYARRHEIDPAHAQQLMAEPARRQISLPFIQLASRSTGERFPLFIEHGRLQAGPTSGSFNSYGLSSKATVPWF